MWTIRRKDTRARSRWRVVQQHAHEQDAIDAFKTEVLKQQQRLGAVELLNPKGERVGFSAAPSARSRW